MTTPHEADLINTDRREQANLMQDHLERIGVAVTIAHYAGDISYPTEYTLMHDAIVATGPTLDLALLDFVEKLLTEKQRREGPALPPQEPQEPTHSTQVAESETQA